VRQKSKLYTAAERKNVLHTGGDEAMPPSPKTDGGTDGRKTSTSFSDETPRTGDQKRRRHGKTAASWHEKCERGEEQSSDVSQGTSRTEKSQDSSSRGRQEERTVSTGRKGDIRSHNPHPCTLKASKDRGGLKEKNKIP